MRAVHWNYDDRQAAIYRFNIEYIHLVGYRCGVAVGVAHTDGVVVADNGCFH
jgi:hypothetical protein